MNSRAEMADVIRRLEEVSLNAWPALQTVVYDGWLLRVADGYTRRANSVNPLYPGALDPVGKIGRCEAVYAARGQDTVFKLTDAAEPADLDDRLEQRGYRREAPTSVQTLDLGALAPPPSVNAAGDAAVTEAWLDDFCRLNGVAERHRPTMRRMLGLLIPSACFMAVRDRGETVAVGLAVREHRHVGLFDIVTAPERRGQGFGTALVHQLLAWGKAGGAHTAYLQVMRDNAPALRLYERLGFRERYGYWYRVRPMRDA
jgi:ribosomal protein S18 acetylase RimI-like enzyme